MFLQSRTRYIFGTKCSQSYTSALSWNNMSTSNELSARSSQRVGMVVAVLGLLIITARMGATQDPPWCPSQCQCEAMAPQQYNVTCSGPTLTKVPEINITGGSWIAHLRLVNCNINILAPVQISGYNRLEMFVLENCQTRHVDGVFSRNIYLKKISLTENPGLHNLSKFTFQQLDGLLELDLSRNALTSYDFVYLSTTTKLFLSHNKISLFARPDSQSGSSVVAEMDLSYNELQTLDGSDLRNLFSLKVLDISNNKLHSVQQNVSLYFNNLNQLKMERNLLHCNCHKRWLKTWFDTNRASKTLEMDCASPLSRKFEVLSESDFQCSRPGFVSRVVDITVTEGETAGFQCLATGDPAPTVSLVNLSSPSNLPVLQYHSRTEVFGEYVLHNTSVGQTGSYQWQISNSEGRVSQQFNVKVTGAEIGSRRPVSQNNPGVIAGSVIGGMFLGLLLAAIVLLLFVYREKMCKKAQTICSCCTCCKCCNKKEIPQPRNLKRLSRANSNPGRPVTTINDIRHPHMERQQNSRPSSGIYADHYTDINPGVYYSQTPDGVSTLQRQQMAAGRQRQASLSGTPDTVGAYQSTTLVRGRMLPQSNGGVANPAVEPEQTYEDVQVLGYEQLHPTYDDIARRRAAAPYTNLAMENGE